MNYTIYYGPDDLELDLTLTITIEHELQTFDNPEYYDCEIVIESVWLVDHRGTTKELSTISERNYQRIHKVLLEQEKELIEEYWSWIQ